MNRREERWGRERRAGDDDEWRRDPGRFRSEDSDVERGAGWGRSGEYQGREPGVRSQSGSGRWDNDASGGRGGDYYAGREDYRGREDDRRQDDRRGSESERGYRRGRHYESERPFGMDFDDGRVQWRRAEPGAGTYGSDRYGSGYEDRAGRGGYPSGASAEYGGARRSGRDESRHSDYGTNYPSGHSFGDETESYGPQGLGRGGARLMHYGRHERGDASTYGRYSGVGPKGYRRSPERLKEQVCDLLEDNGELDASDIEVNVEDGTVTLTGSVENRFMKRLAEDLAGNVAGISDVSNQLKVSPRAEKEGLGAEGSRSKTTSSRSSGTGATGSKPGF